MANDNSKADSRLRKSKSCEERYIKVNETYYLLRVSHQRSITLLRLPYCANPSDEGALVTESRV